ncbi:hypothetical protein TNIN_141421 [Trichonephila inaurata madagascariensis]|uniref:Uncharacterized protein n=1 Tax=Trichonephila inaurata madagascariensis TaxID=2747483 RepID=A0A8X6I2T8_9ARAC|nr:hypothetical protein TNIN_141421 [Trichonephila inaurata madagascariensis]
MSKPKILEWDDVRVLATDDSHIFLSYISFVMSHIVLEKWNTVDYNGLHQLVALIFSKTNTYTKNISHRKSSSSPITASANESISKLNFPNQFRELVFTFKKQFPMC